LSNSNQQLIEKGTSLTVVDVKVTVTGVAQVTVSTEFSPDHRGSEMTKVADES
jgi:hypothetical protein